MSELIWTAKAVQEISSKFLFRSETRTTQGRLGKLAFTWVTLKNTSKQERGNGFWVCNCVPYLKQLEVKFSCLLWFNFVLFFAVCSLFYWGIQWVYGRKKFGRGKKQRSISLLISKFFSLQVRYKYTWGSEGTNSTWIQKERQIDLMLCVQSSL
jgi:hypothetical protein